MTRKEIIIQEITRHTSLENSLIEHIANEILEAFKEENDKKYCKCPIQKRYKQETLNQGHVCANCFKIIK